MRIGKCDCGGEKFIIGKNYFLNWEQHKCKSCGKTFGVSFEEFIKEDDCGCKECINKQPEYCRG